jgi:hypothetical protein
MGITFLLADCTSGSYNDPMQVIVTDKEYEPPYTTYSTDSEGHLKSTHHPAVYKLYFSNNGSWTCSRSDYNRYNVDDILLYQNRLGRWTQWNYHGRIIGHANQPVE